MKAAVLVFSAVVAFLGAGSALAHSSDHDRDRYERRDWHHQRHFQPHHQGYYSDRGDYRHFRDRGYRVDWRYHALPRPMHGYSWVHTGRGFALVDDYSGQIVSRVRVR